MVRCGPRSWLAAGMICHDRIGFTIALQWAAGVDGEEFATEVGWPRLEWETFGQERRDRRMPRPSPGSSSPGTDAAIAAAFRLLGPVAPAEVVGRPGRFRPIRRSPAPRRLGRPSTVGQPSAMAVNDGDLVVAAGTPEGWGVGVIAGTGSIAVGRAQVGWTYCTRRRLGTPDWR